MESYFQRNKVDHDLPLNITIKKHKIVAIPTSAHFAADTLMIFSVLTVCDLLDMVTHIFSSCWKEKLIEG